MSHSRTTWIEGVNDHIEAGRWMFTAVYHWKRGHCCENGCRHCPYGNAPAEHDRFRAQGCPFVWANCMTFLFDHEKKASADAFNGFVDAANYVRAR